MRLKASVRKFLENERVCHVVAAGKIYFATDAQSQKARNLQRGTGLNYLPKSARLAFLVVH